MTERTKLIKYFEAHFLDGESIKDCGKAMIRAEWIIKEMTTFILADRRRIVEPLIMLKKSWTNPNPNYQTKLSPTEAMDKTLKNAGL